MISEAHIKENLSRSYVQAVAAKAGVNIEIDGRSHDYGFDGSFHQVVLIGDKWADSGISLDFQLKASTCCSFEQNSVSYEMDVSTYNSLSNRSERPRATPAILILLALPKDPESWLSLNEEQLVLRHCCYWEVMPSGGTSNQRSITIRIPREKLLTPERLSQMIEHIAQTGKLN
jgi:Domain of unknown function (DUF4365)